MMDKLLPYPNITEGEHQDLLYDNGLTSHYFIRTNNGKILKVTIHFSVPSNMRSYAFAEQIEINDNVTEGYQVYDLTSVDYILLGTSKTVFRIEVFVADVAFPILPSMGGGTRTETIYILSLANRTGDNVTRTYALLNDFWDLVAVYKGKIDEISEYLNSCPEPYYKYQIGENE